jgi:hypothetical protein
MSNTFNRETSPTHYTLDAGMSDDMEIMEITANMGRRRSMAPSPRPPTPTAVNWTPLEGAHPPSLHDRRSQLRLQHYRTTGKNHHTSRSRYHFPIVCASCRSYAFVFRTLSLSTTTGTLVNFATPLPPFTGNGRMALGFVPIAPVAAAVVAPLPAP